MVLCLSVTGEVGFLIKLITFFYQLLALIKGLALIQNFGVESLKVVLTKLSDSLMIFYN